MLTRDIVAQLLSEAVETAKQQAILPAVTLKEVIVERPQNSDHGDFASNLPLQLSRSVGIDPLTIAELLVPLIRENDAVDKVWAAPPGFLNFTIKPRWLQQQVEVINDQGDRYGNSEVGSSQRIQLEFVSVNPTGPVHVGHARGAVLGSALANVLLAAGFDVSCEYYVNDAGSQMELFNHSLFARYAQALGQDEEVPINGYQGAYLEELGEELSVEFGSRFLKLTKANGVAEIGAIGLERMLYLIRSQLEQLGVKFDVWFSERDLFKDHQYDRAMDIIREKGFTVQREGALWFTSSTLGDDKDNVLVRSTGQPTYFASDVAYHYNKFAERGFDRVIDIWGADHQGHVPRMKVVLGALGIDPDRLTIIISQLVTLRRSGVTVRASKRTGEMITLSELVEEVGVDACRYFFLARAAESQMEFDLELAVKESPDNPVYYVQYAHARIASILRQAQERRIDWIDGDLALITDKAELALIRKMVMLPEIIENVVQTLAPHHLPHYAIELATAFHWFYDHCRVLTNNPGQDELTKARLKLCQASKTVLSRTLDLMGMTIPEKM